MEDLYLAHRALIERAISHVCRRHRLSGVDAEDFASSARLSLIENDHARLRAFSGRSSLPTYLVVVIGRLFQDWRNAQWGKWRPSAEAQRLGPLAVQLETLTVRDHLTFDQAVETLRTNHGVTESEADLAALAARFPSRPGRTFTSDDALADLADTTMHTDAGVTHAEAVATATGARHALDRALDGLAPQDRLIIKMRFDSNFAVADIAKTLKLEAKPLYRRIERVLGDLRARLEAAGIDAPAIREAIQQRGFDAAGELRGEVRPFSGGARPTPERVP